VLLDKGMSCRSIAEVLLLDGDTIRTWYQPYQEDGIEGLASFGHEGGTCRLTAEQQEKLKAWIAETLPRSTRAVGAWIAAECGIEYQTRSGLIALLHRLGMEHRKPKAISRKSPTRISCGTSQSSGQQHDAGCVEERGGGSDRCLEILGEPAVSIDPGEEPLDHPSARQHLEANLIG